jgi:pre-mRNA cleavage complex 2 protein Pcf11
MSYQTYQPHYQPPAAAYYNPPVAPIDPFRAYYADRLRELTFNSRPLIQDLSVMAMQQRDQGNWPGMRVVVEEIETAVLRVCW